MKKWKRVFSVLLVCGLVLSLLPTTAFAANTVSGYCGGEGNGSNLTWTLDLDTGALVISGRGAMADYSTTSAPWYSYVISMTSLTIGNGVTSIGDSAFYNCSGFTGSLTIPGSVTSIGDSAFYNCSGFTGSLTIPDSVTTIGNLAFYDCSGFTDSLTIPDSVTSIGEAAFMNCSGFTGTLTIPDSVTSIGDSAFYNCSGFTGSLTIPDSVTTIGDFAFDGCKGFTGSLTIGDSVTSIGRFAFLGCSGFTGSLTIPGSVTSIGSSAFVWCSGFTGSLTISDSVTSISGAAFSGCSGFTGSLTIPDSVTSIDDYAFRDCSGFTGPLTIPDSVTTIGSGAFKGCSGFTGALTIGDSVTSISEYAFYNCGGFMGVYFRGDAPAVTGSDTYNHSFPTNLTLYYIEGKAGWTSPTWMGYQTATWNGILPIASPISVPDGRYCIHVVNENGEGLPGALVTYNGVPQTTDQDGNAYFSALTSGTPVITAELSGYTSWTNENSSWEKSSNRYSVIVLYPEALGAYKLAEARYSNLGILNFDLLTHTKTLSLKNTGNWIGDLDFGNFYITCRAGQSDGVERYELWQGNKKISNCTDGTFPQLSVESFSKGGNCFIRVVTTDGNQVDTNINLEFVENAVNGASSISLGKKISIKVGDDVPFLGGSTFDISFPMLPVDFVASDEKLHIGFNVLRAGTDEGKDKYEELKKTLDKVKQAKDGALGAATTKELKSFLQNDESVSLPGGKFNVYLLGYAEADWGSSEAKGELYMLIEAQTKTFGFNTVVAVVPVTVQVKAGVEFKAGGAASYNWETSEFHCNVDLDLTMGLDAFVGPGVGKAFGVGAYGSAELEIAGQPLGTDQGLEKIDLTGELGIKAYLGWVSYEKPFAHNTWHLYTGNAVQPLGLMGEDSSSLWSDYYDASQYQIENLSYLYAESDWLSGGLSLFEADANTNLTALLEGTYRNAQPVMIQAGDALYAAFLRGDVETGHVSVWITRFNGSAWAEPVQVDGSAILDDAPVLCVDNSGTIWLAYARTREDPGSSLLAYAQNQSVVVGSIDPGTLAFTECRDFPGVGYAHMQQLAVVNGVPTLIWTDSAVTDDDSVLMPQSSRIYSAAFTGSAWSDSSLVTEVDSSLWELTPGETNGALAVAYIVDEDSDPTTTADQNLYRCSGAEPELLAVGVSGHVTFGTLPGTVDADFVWNGADALYTAAGGFVEVPGITGEFTIVGNRIYYSTATGGSADLAVLQYEDGQWGLPIQLTDGQRYLESLSAAELNGRDYVFGLHTLATISEDGVTAEKNLVWAAVMPVSDLRLEDASYEIDQAAVGEAVPVTLTVTNAGDHTVSSVDILRDQQIVTTETCDIKPGESAEFTVTFTCPDSLTEYEFTVQETNQDDFTPTDNCRTVKIGYADIAVELAYQQIGSGKALVAFLTNQGVETASGSLIFYDADGNAVGESKFESLAAGDTAVAIYEVDQNFAGIGGGDVFARVLVEQGELYTYNNQTTLHINKAYAPTAIQEARISGTTVYAEIACSEDDAGTAYCAAYDAQGKMLSVTVKALSSGENNSVSFSLEDAAATVKIFVLDVDGNPLCKENVLKR